MVTGGGGGGLAQLSQPGSLKLSLDLPSPGVNNPANATDVTSLPHFGLSTPRPGPALPPRAPTPHAFLARFFFTDWIALRPFLRPTQGGFPCAPLVVVASPPTARVSRPPSPKPPPQALPCLCHASSTRATQVSLPPLVTWAGIMGSSFPPSGPKSGIHLWFPTPPPPFPPRALFGHSSLPLQILPLPRLPCSTRFLMTWYRVQPLKTARLGFHPS